MGIVCEVDTNNGVFQYLCIQYLYTKGDVLGNLHWIYGGMSNKREGIDDWQNSCVIPLLIQPSISTYERIAKPLSIDYIYTIE